MDMELKDSLMAIFTEENTKKVSSMEKEGMYGQTDLHMREGSLRAADMGKETGNLQEQEEIFT